MVKCFKVIHSVRADDGQFVFVFGVTGNRQRQWLRLVGLLYRLSVLWEYFPKNFYRLLLPHHWYTRFSIYISEIYDLAIYNKKKAYYIFRLLGIHEKWIIKIVHNICALCKIQLYMMKHMVLAVLCSHSLRILSHRTDENYEICLGARTNTHMHAYIVMGKFTYCGGADNTTE